MTTGSVTRDMAASGVMKSSSSSHMSIEKANEPKWARIEEALRLKDELILQLKGDSNMFLI
jgi:hypothetical protein